MDSSGIKIFGTFGEDLVGWQSGAAVSLQPFADSGVEEVDTVIDASTGPLEDKRQRLRAWDRMKASRVLSASTTVTVSAQRRWAPRAHIIGIDALLMAAGGRIVTVAGADPDDFQWLNSLWPARIFVNVADSVGHIFSREILPIINEAVDVLARGVPPEDIDQGTKLGLNYPKGPLEWADLFGWEAVYWGLAALEDMYGPRFRPHPWIRARLGRSLWDRESR